MAKRGMIDKVEMEVDLSKLEIVRKYKPEVVNVKRFSKHPPLYCFIRFWGRLPDYLLDDLINTIKSRGGDILFDPFGGSGSILFMAIGRDFSKIIYNDLNPAFAFITKAIYDGLYIPRNVLIGQIDNLVLRLTSSPVILDLLKIQHTSHSDLFIHKIAYDKLLTFNKNPKKITLKFRKKVLNETAELIIKIVKRRKFITFSSLRKEADEYLKKNYGKIGARILFSTILNKLIDKGIIREEIKKDHLVLSSSFNFPKDLKILTVNEKIDEILKKKERKYRFLINKKAFSYNLRYSNDVPFKKAESAKTLGDLYPLWSRILLSLIWREIEHFPIYNRALLNVFKVCFLASLYDASLMQMPHKSGWIIKSFWIPTPCAVKNPVNIFVKKLNEFISLYDYFQGKLNNQTEVMIYNKNILDFSKNDLKDEPDVVITHPPYFSTVQYGELSTIWASWLNCEIPFRDEIVENFRQGKNKYTYLQLLKKALEKIASLSRKDADIILIFQSKNQKNWELLDKILLELPFELEQIRCYQRTSWWGSKHIFSIGSFDYALIFKKRG
jgi:16S rRNA G966 N2-methylase RsmD